MIRILFFLATAGIFAFVMTTASHVALLDTASILSVVIPCLFLAAGYLGPGSLAAAIVAAGKSEAIPPGVALQHRETLQGLRSLLCTCGAVGSIIGMVQMLNHLSDFNTFHVALALVITTGLYALILSELLVAPMINSFQVLDPDPGEGTPVKSTKPVLSLLLVLGGFLFLGLVMWLGRAWAAFLDTTAFILVFGGGLGCWLTQYRSGVFRAFRLAWNPAAGETQDMTEAYQVLRTGRDLFLMTGGVGFFMGTMGVFQNLNDPSKIGPSMAIALLSLFYSLYLGLLICAPLMHRVGAKLGTHATPPPALVHRWLQTNGTMAPIVTTSMQLGFVLLSFLAISAVP